MVRCIDVGNDINDFLLGLAVGAIADVALIFLGGSLLNNLVSSNKSYCSQYTGAKNKLCLGKCIYWKGKPEFQECMTTGGVKG